MNSHTKETVENCARQAGAVEPCSLGCDYHVYAFDEEADRRTYALATNAWKAVDSGFRGMTLDQVRSVVKQFLESSSDQCPNCQ